jgi:hypothetical protein
LSAILRPFLLPLCLLVLDQQHGAQLVRADVIESDMHAQLDRRAQIDRAAQ